jgi:hypothetical protein
VILSDAAKIGRVSLIRLGSVTHSLNMDERMLSLAFSQHSNVVATTSTPQARSLLKGTNDLFDSRGYSYNVFSQKYDYTRVYYHHVGG